MVIVCQCRKFLICSVGLLSVAPRKESERVNVTFDKCSVAYVIHLIPVAPIVTLLKVEGDKHSLIATIWGFF